MRLTVESKPLRIALFCLITVVLAAGFGCAKKFNESDILQTLNASRDVYNFAYTQGYCDSEQAKPICVKYHDTIDAGYSALRIYHATQSDGNLRALLVILEEIAHLRSDFVSITGVPQ